MNEVEEIKERLDLADVIGGYLPLKNAGRNLKAPCPFHQEKTASFMVSPEKGIWHCFGCHKGGDVFKFVMEMEGLDFRGALEQLARRAGVELKGRGRDPQEAKRKERLQAATAEAVKYFQASLVQNPGAVNYLLKRRHLNKSSIQDFQIGYAPDDWQALTSYLKKHKFSDDELVAAGLAGRKSDRVYDLFRGRIMLTICDGSGRPAGFTGRVLDDGEPKYLNTPQTPLYDKSRIIYGLHLAREAIRTSGEVVLVEGNMDVVASHQAGVKQVVAVSGTALTLDQLKTLSRLTKNVKLAFDQDAAGLAATERAIELAQQLSLTLSVVTIPDAKDPDELIQRDPELWPAAIAGAPYVIDYLFDRFSRDYDLTSGVGKRQFGERLSQSIQRLNDPVERDHYVKRLSTTLGISEAAAGEKVAQAQVPEPAPRAAVNRVEPEEIEQPDAATSLEESILSLNLAYPELRISLDELTQEQFMHEDRRAILTTMQQNHGDEVTAIAKLLPHLSDYVKILGFRGEEEFGSLAPADRSIEAFVLSRRLQTLANQQLKREVSRQLRVAEDEGNAELAHELLQQYQALMAEDN